MRKIIINACITGMVPTRELTPHIPLSTSEIADCALECAELGASIIHLHPRDKDGLPTWEKQVFEEIINKIKKKNKHVLISVTTSGRNWSEFEKRSACLEIKGALKPDFASLTVGSMNFINTASVNDPDIIKRLAQKMKDNGIKPELEIFEPGMIHMAKYLIRKELISNIKPYFNLFFGSLGTMPLEPSSIASYHALLPESSVWSAGGVGDFQLDTNIMGIALGGHVRVGIEDSIFFDRKKEIHATNQDLIRRITEIIKIMELEIATPEEAREILF